MSEADQFPDPDLSFLEGTTGSDIAAVGRGIDDAAQQLEQQTRVITDNAEGATVGRVQESLVEIKQALEKSAAAFDRMQAAWETWKATAPRQAEIAFAERSVQDARQRLMDAEDRHAALLRRQLKMAQAKLKELIEKRKAADAALAEALEAAGQNIPRVEIPLPLPGGRTPGLPGGPMEEKPGTGNTTPGSPAPAPPAELPGATAPPAELPNVTAPAAPGGELPGAGAPLPAPDTSLSGEAPAAVGGGNANQAAALAGLLGQQQQQAQPQAQPQMSPAMAAMPQIPQAQQPQKQPDTAGAAGGDMSSLYDLINSIAPAAAVAAPLTFPSLSTPPALSTPGIAPVTYSPATPWNTPGGSLSAAPAVNPIVTGTSVSGLTTDSNVTGRADGTAPRTATSPGSATHLAGAAGAAAGAEAGAGQRGAAGMGGTPIMGGPIGGMGGGAGTGKEREQVKANQTSDHFVLNGEIARSEAVPGGTIAQKRDDAA
jgi:hypothetical protein